MASWSSSPAQASSSPPVGLFHRVYPLVADEVTKRLAMQQPHEMLKRRAKQAVRDFIRSA